jgi:hypothetical protein
MKGTKKKVLSAIIFFMFTIVMMTVPAEAERAIYEIGTRPSVSIKILLHTPDKQARGTLLFFPGSQGKGHFSQINGQIKTGSNFLVRTSPMFVEKGFAVAIIDVPSDNTGGMSDGFRRSEEHAKDIVLVMDFLKAKKSGPIYLAGTSRGTISAAYLATVIKDPLLGGLVLTATMGDRKYAGGVQLEKITIPVLFVHHLNDGCEVSRSGDAYDMKRRISSSPKVDFVEVDGGSSSEDAYKTGRKFSRSGPDPCSPGSHHGFVGVEDKVVTIITNWLSGKPVTAR